MVGVYFVHQIKHNIQQSKFEKGIVVKDAEGADNFADAKQVYHAYLGAYAYGHDPNCDYVQCQITNLAGTVLEKFSETWDALPGNGEDEEEESEEEEEPEEVPE